MGFDESIYADLVTVGDYIRWTLSKFYQYHIFCGHGTDTPWDEAVLLVLSALHLPFDIDQRVFDTRLTHREKETVLALLKARVEQRLPLPYITREAWFGGYSFYIDHRALVPRSPFAELIEQKFEPWIDSSQIKSVLEIGTGSGCIALTLARVFPEAEIIATDVSWDALQVALINRKNFELEGQVQFVQTNLWEGIQKAFDLIVSNPPYVSEQEWESLPEEYHKEPKMALVANRNGLELVDQILETATEILTEEGILFIEVGFSQAQFEQSYPKLPINWIEFEKGGQGIFCITGKQLREIW